MVRKKVKLAFISNASRRKETYKKRKKGIIKKVSELTILCGIPACAIISDPFNSKTEVWPNRKEAKQVIKKYQSSHMKDDKKNVNQETFLLQQITNAREHLQKLRQTNREKELNVRLIGYKQNMPDDLTVSELKEFDKIIEKNMKEIDEKIVALNLSD